MKKKVFLFIVAIATISLAAVTTNQQSVSASEVCTYVNNDYRVGVCYDDGKTVPEQSENRPVAEANSNWFYNWVNYIWTTVKGWFAR